MEAGSPQPPAPLDPPQDPPGKTAPMPEYVAVFLHAVRILLGYGRHLLATVERRATTPTFPAIAACFGTSNLPTILAHLNRGILRAAALQRFLLARAATGRDIDIVIRRTRTDEAQAAPADAQAEPPADQPAKPNPAPRPSPPPGCDDPELFMPTPEELDRQVRRRAVGRTIGEICRDLAVVPAFCTPAFWNRLFELMHYFGGSVATLMREKSRREQAFVREQDRKLDSTWDWLHLKRDEIRQILGFFIAKHRSIHSPTPPHGWPPARPDPQLSSNHHRKPPLPRNRGRQGGGDTYKSANIAAGHRPVPSRFAPRYPSHPHSRGGTSHRHGPPRSQQ